MRLTLLLLMFMLLFFTSCRKKTYHRLTIEEISFLCYNVNDTFKLKNEMTGDTLTYMVTNRYLTIKETKNDISLIKKHYDHEGQVELKIGNQQAGSIFIRKNATDVFELNISILTDESWFGGNGNHFELLPTLDVNGTTYTTVFKFTGDLPAYTYFNQTYGFLKLEYPDSNWVYTRVL